jgi:hypothetical protein
MVQPRRSLLLGAWLACALAGGGRAEWSVWTLSEHLDPAAYERARARLAAMIVAARDQTGK